MSIVLWKTCGFLRKLGKNHLKSIQATLGKLRAAKLTARPSKCKIGYSKIECHGLNIQGQTFRPKDDKIQAIIGAQRPVTKKQVWGFLGLAGFYWSFTPNFSEVAAPLTDLTKKITQIALRTG